MKKSDYVADLLASEQGLRNEVDRLSNRNIELTKHIAEDANLIASLRADNAALAMQLKDERAKSIGDHVRERISFILRGV